MSLRSDEIRHYSLLLADLHVSALRTSDPGLLARLRVELVEAYTDIFTLLSHDAATVREAAELVSDLMVALGSSAPVSRERSSV